MARPLPQLASFLLASLLAYTGLATADQGRPGRISLGSLHAPALAGNSTQQERLHAARVNEAALWRALVATRLAALQGAAGRVAAPPGDDLVLLRARVAAILQGTRARVAVHIRELGHHAALFDHDGDARLNPASNHKLVTAIASTELLGADYRFETRVERDDDTLYLIGEGDPSLQLRHLHALAAEVVARGEHHGVTRIVVDDSAFSPDHVGPGYHADADASYEAPSGALSLAFNTVEITVTPGRHGEPAAVAITPPSAHVVVDGVVRTGKGRALTVTSARDGDRTRIHVDGALRGGHAPVVERRRIADPGLFTGGAFAAVLAELAGEGPLPVERGLASPLATPVAAHTSAPLASVLASALKYSNNFTTEQVLRTLGWRASGRPGAWEDGSAAIAELWAAVGNDPADLVFENGSGLSSRGRVSARGLVRLLELTGRDGSPAALLLAAFAGPGGEGTLRLRMPRARDRVRGKTGTIGGVSALSGVVASRAGDRRIAFSILMNGREDPRQSRRIQDKVVLALVDHLDR